MTATPPPLPDHDDRRQALTDFQHNLVVTAGAGTGKTSLLVGRLVAALVLHHLEPDQILAVTFTENAATEMRQRLLRMLTAVRPWLAGEAIETSDRYILEQLGIGPEDASRVDDLVDRIESITISTFHGFCLRFLREHARRLDLPPDLGVGETRTDTGALDDVFLEVLREASETSSEWSSERRSETDGEDGGMHPALLRFDPTELRELAEECLELPLDSLDRIADAEPPSDLLERLGDLQRLIEEFGAARPAWRSAAADFAACYRAVIDGQQPHSEWIEKATPKAGVKLGELAEHATSALDAHRRFLKPWILADQEGVALAVDFIRPVIVRYRQRVAVSGELSFQDLLLLARRSLMRDAKLRAELGRRLRAILVDEFQDTDPLQYDVIFLLAESAHDEGPRPDPMTLPLRPGTLFIVGDAKQSIYRFRRADVAAFTRAMESVAAQDGRVLRLSANFRSQRPILDFVNAVCDRSLAENRPYQFGYEPVVPIRDPADSAAVELLQVDAAGTYLSSDERRHREGNILVRRIAELHAAGTPYRDIAILLRATTETSWILRPLRSAGVPYVLEGSRRFYQRQEIVWCRALLAAMARPHDPVATLAILRSTACSASDADIFEYVESGQSLDFRLAKGGSGPIAACLTRLRELHLRVSELPIDAALIHLFTLPEHRLAEAAGFEGAQRIANIDRLLQKLLRRAPLDLADAATILARDTDLETDDEESALFDGGVEAVRVLTVHRAKGLEFPVVFVPDLARQSSYREKLGLAQAQRLFDADGKEIVTIRIGDTRNAASLLNQNAGRDHDEAEQRRLFYVAATRAKDRLILIGGEPTERKRLWQNDVEVGVGQVDQKVVTGTRPGRGSSSDAVDAAATLRAHAAHAERRQRLWANLPGEDVAPSRAPATATERTPAKAEAQLTFDFAKPTESPVHAAATHTRDAAMAIGSAMHVYLAVVDFHRDAVDEELLQSLPHAEDLRDMAERFHRSRLRQELITARRVHRETPLTFVAEDAQIHGVVDLILEAADGTTMVLDYKTNQLDSTPPRECAEQYRQQLSIYGRGVQRALDLPMEPTVAVHFLREDTTIRL